MHTTLHTHMRALTRALIHHKWLLYHQRIYASKLLAHFWETFQKYRSDIPRHEYLYIIFCELPPCATLHIG